VYLFEFISGYNQRPAPHPNHHLWPKKANLKTLTLKPWP